MNSLPTVGDEVGDAVLLAGKLFEVLTRGGRGGGFFSTVNGDVFFSTVNL